MKKINLFPVFAAVLLSMTYSPVKAVENNADTATSLFDSLKDKYDDLSNQFGDISAPDSEAFNSYLKTIQSNKDSLEFDKTLDSIKNFDYSTSNNKYIDEIMKKAKENNDAVKSNSEDLAKAFEQKYAQAEKDAAAEKAKAEAAGKKDYNDGMNEYQSMKTMNAGKKAEVQGIYSSYLDRYHAAVAGGGDLSGNFKKYDLPGLNDKVLEKISAEIGITTPKVQEKNKKNTKKAVKQLTKGKSTVSKTPQKLYTSNAYMNG